jgi:GpU protein
MALVGTFGNLVFETSGSRIHTFSEMTISTQNRFAQHDVHLEVPILEFVGPGLAEVNFKMNFSKQWGSDPMTSILSLRTYLRLGKASPLLVGMRPITNGTNLFVCTQLGEEYKFFDAQGKLFGAAIDVTLREYRQMI